MFQSLLRGRVVFIVLVSGLVLGLLVGTVLGSTIFANHNSAASTSARNSHHTAPLTTVTIPLAQDVFDPFILTIQPHTTVTWKNKDTVAHRFITTPDQKSYLNPQAFALNVAAGKSVSYTFGQPGMYHYYDNTLATWNVADARIAAQKGVPNYPLAMDGVIWVKGHIDGLPSATTNRIPHNHDDFVEEFLAINAGSVSWHNFDTDPHFLAPVPGWAMPTNPSQHGINPADIGINRIAGTTDVPGGDTITVVFNTPGLYYYYCPNHAKIQPSFRRAEAFSQASEYPISMEGFVLVVGS